MKRTKIEFNEDYYQEIVKEYGYSLLEFEPINFGLGNASLNYLKKKFICHYNGRVFSENLKRGKKSIITSGIGLSGNPHMGTIAQIMNIINLQKNGLFTQFVLGDLDSYNSRNQPLDVVKERAKKYRDFIIKLGYDTEKGILRSQLDHPEIILTGYIISKYLTDSDFKNTEEDISYIYKQKGIYPGIEFPIKLSILLMLSDFIHLGMKENYENVLVMLGIDEHKYVRLAAEVINRMKSPMRLGGIYSRLIKGFNGYPKMSKSIPESNISVDTPFEEIEDKIMNHEGNFTDPMDSVVYQLMTLVSSYNAEELDELYRICKKGGEEWRKAKRRYLDEHLFKIIEKWTK